MRLKRMSYVLLAFFCLVLCFSIIGIINISSAETLYVDDSGGSDFVSIQEAIDNANTSDTIYINAGTYIETININKEVILQGEDSSTVLIKGSGNHTLRISQNNISIFDISVQNSGISSDFSGIFIKDVTHCTVQRIRVKYAGNGLYLVSTSNNAISTNIFELCNCGIYCSNADDNIIATNDLQNNNLYGIYFTATSTNNICYENDFSNNPVKHSFDAGSNTWSYENQGNYWDDYQGYDNNSDGIGDTPYIIDSNSLDAYPLGDFLSINQQPTAYIDSISPNEAYAGTMITFTGHGSDTDGIIVEYQWQSSKDGVLGSSSTITSSSLSLGTHTISFRVKDDENQWSDYVSETIIIIEERETPTNTPPTASIVSINPLQAIEGEVQFFHGYGTDTDGSIQEYQWSSNIDGILSIQSSFSTSDLSIGIHTISFRVRDNQGVWSNSVTASVTILENTSAESNQAPTILTGGPYKSTINKTIAFDGSQTYDPDKDVLTAFTWDFGDGNSSTGTITTHAYTLPGNYTVTLTVVDEHSTQSIKSTYAVITSEENDASHEQNEESNENTPGFGIVFIFVSILFYIFFRRLT